MTMNRTGVGMLAVTLVGLKLLGFFPFDWVVVLAPLWVLGSTAIITEVWSG